MKLSLLSALLFMLACVVNLSAAVVTVTTLADTEDLVCDAHCSLREAVFTAVPGDTIVFARGLRGGTINLTKTLMLPKRIIIDGPNKRRITLKGDRTFRIIEARGVISIDGLILRDGAATDGDGGGIYVRPPSSATLNLTEIAILDCAAQRGGGIHMQGGTLILTNSVVAGNTATGDGGGGGIDTFLSTVWITNSTFSGNKSTSTTDGAGGLLLTQPESWFIKNSTIVFNSANGTSSRSVGGLAAYNGNPGPLYNTILAKNTGLNPDFEGRSGGSYNIVGISDVFVNGSVGNIVGRPEAPADPKIAPLTDNGGGLPMHALLPNSPAIDSGDNNQATDRSGRPLTTDQRGYPRIVNSIVDRGAFEYDSPAPATNSTITGEVKTASGRAVSGALVKLRSAGGEVRYSVTNPFGFFRFPDVPAGAVYVVECLDKRNEFPAQEILTEEFVEYVNFQN